MIRVICTVVTIYSLQNSFPKHRKSSFLQGLFSKVNNLSLFIFFLYRRIPNPWPSMVAFSHLCFLLWHGRNGIYCSKMGAVCNYMISLFFVLFFSLLLYVLFFFSSFFFAFLTAANYSDYILRKQSTMTPRSLSWVVAHSETIML